MTNDEFDLVSANALEFAKGNISDWVRNRCMYPMLPESLAMQEREELP